MNRFPIKLPLGAGVVEIVQFNAHWRLRFIYTDGTLCPVERGNVPVILKLWELTAEGPVRAYATDMPPQMHYQACIAGDIPQWLLPQMELLRHVPEIYTMSFAHYTKDLPADRQPKAAREVVYSGTYDACRWFGDVIDGVDVIDIDDDVTREVAFLREYRKSWNREIVKINDDRSALILHTML